MFRIVVLVITLGSVCANAFAAGVLRLTNAGPTGRDIPLLAGSLVHFDADGTLRMECDPGAAACLGASTPSPSALPSATLSRIDAEATLTAGEAIKLAWTSSQVEVCKASVTGGAATTWTGARAAVSAVGESITLAQQGTYTFELLCYNLAGGKAATPVSVTVAAGESLPPPPPLPPPTAGCGIASADPAFQPAGWKRIDKTWAQNFSAPDGSPSATYPDAISWPVPVGSQRGAYTAIAFTPNAGQTVQLHWDRIQARGSEYTVRPAWGMFFAISPCPGDLRAVDSQGSDGWLMEGCREFASSATLMFTTKASSPQSNGEICKLEAGKTYYLNIAPVDPAGGLAPGEHACDDVPNSAVECHVGALISTSS